MQPAKQLAKHIVFRTLTPSLVPKTVECIGYSFASSNDPFTAAFKYTPIQWGMISNMFVRRAGEKDLSVVAYNEQEDRVEGVMINEDWKEKQPDFYRQLDDWRPVRAIFNELHTRFKAHNSRIDYGRILHPLYFTCVRPEYRGQGLLNELWERTLETARARNYEAIVAEGSTPAAEAILTTTRIGFKEAVAVPFSEFLYEGEPVYRHLTSGQHGFKKLAMYQRDVNSNLYI
eukprot:TRINITY_DN23150_c0_g1_i1.p1 TRINITY_DN23150_c0_g1~~TRINITY_DN23150_c0_g1_i1.p1  ORF type:complete len:231 (+),score=24.08 TRINITY_DN23150_c0_g1_i1:181-873(+)